MAQRPSPKEAAPAEQLTGLSSGYNGYTDVTETNPKMWSFSTNVFSGAFSFIQRCRFANVVSPSPLTSNFFTTLKYFALPPFTISTSISSIVYAGGSVPFATVTVSSTSGIGPSGSISISDNTNVLFNSTFQIGTIINSTSLTIVFSQVAAASGTGGTLDALNSGGAYLIADIAGLLYSYDTGLNYAQTQRFNPYVDPLGLGNPQLNGPWSREALVNILYEMNGQVKMAGRLANAAIIEGWGLDSPDSTPQVQIFAAVTTAILTIARSNGVVTITVSAPGTAALTGLLANSNILQVSGVNDTTFNGAFVVTYQGGVTFTWPQIGQDVSTAGGTIGASISKAVGRSYAWAWENANKSHVGALSPVTQYIAYNAQWGLITLREPGTLTINNASPIVIGTNTQFTAAWIGRSIVSDAAATGRIISVQSPTQLTLAANAPATTSGIGFQIYDPQATHVRLYETADGGATYFLTQRNVFHPTVTGTNYFGLQFADYSNTEPPAFPFSTETAQLNNVPPPVGRFVNEFQGRLCVFGVPGEERAFFYSNVEATLIGQPQESFAPLNQVTLPIQNASLNGMMELPGSMILWSDKQDMFRLTGLLTDNLVGSTATQQGASISRLPYALGCASPFAVAVTSLGGFWLTPNDEVWLFTDRYAPRNVGRPIQDILLSMAPGTESMARMVYYHTANRNWLLLLVAANGATFNNTVLVLDLDLLASNGEASYYTFDMATNSPAWWVFQPGTQVPAPTTFPLNIPATTLPWNPTDPGASYFAIGGTGPVSIPCSPGQQITFLYQSGLILGANVPPPFDGTGLGPLTTGGVHPWPSDRLPGGFATGSAGECCGAFVDGGGLVLGVFRVDNSLTTPVAPAGTAAVTIGVNLVGNNYTTSTGSWNYVYSFVGASPLPPGTWIPRCDSIEVVYETGGLVRLMCGQVDLIQDIDFIMGGFGTELDVPNGTVTLHPFGNENPFLIKRPTFVRFNTNRDPSMLATDGWTFAVQGIDDDFYTFFNPLVLDLVPGQNDTSALSGSPDFTGGLAFRHSPELFRIGGVNFVMGRRLKFQINFPPAAGSNFQFRGIQMAFGANPPN